MYLTTASQGELYCTFSEQDIKHFFSMSFDVFSKNRGAVEKFADILIRKAINLGRTEAYDGEKYDITLYQLEEEEYAILLSKSTGPIVSSASNC